eukprot:CAMPEP_0194255690 /NCGR_PEP_ID=MMETSP0158-20130606/35038_1 /TAXON_ID=33649 /ORGANISM="Thalassionema nitzschioides, Strain L26-B" /LENGTH=263 /DNA_ID=CAMNT_0038994133 /DNA_START=27 /DNA_END=818 /DNA_ORIENTATION=+
MMFSFNTCRFALVFAVACNALVSATQEDPVELLSAGNYVILAKTGISTVPDSVITGDIGVSPIAGTAMTGFSLTADSTNEFSKSAQLVGKAFAASFAAPIPTHLTTAVGAMETAYTDAASRLNGVLNLGTGQLGLGGNFGGEFDKLTPGVYTFNTDVVINDTIYFRGTGTGVGEGDSDVFIIQTTGTLLQVKNTRVELENGALAKNIFWQVAGNVAVEVGAHMEGILLVKTDVLFMTGSSINGRVLAQTACNLQMATITAPVG